MQTARRLYVYLLSGISLGVLLTGLTMLLGLLLESLGLGPSGEALFDRGEGNRQQLTVAAAITAVGLPLWLAHWTAAERSVRVDRPTAAAERTSDVRGLYFAIAMGALLLVTAMALSSLIRESILGATGSAIDYGSGIGGDLAALLVAGAAWAYHVWMRSRDWARGPMTGGGAALPRTYLYVAAFIGLWVFLTGFTSLMELAGRAILGEPDLGYAPGESWWAYPLADAVSGIVVGGATWVGHLLYARGLMRDAGWRGASERPARLRLAYFVVAIVATAGASLFLTADAARNVLEAVFGISEASGSQLAGLIALPLLSAAAFGVTALLHARAMEAEAGELGDDERVETVDRLRAYPLALVGVAFGAFGLAWVLGLVVDLALPGGPLLSGGESYRAELARFVPLTLLGLGLWLVSWHHVGARWMVDPSGEAASTVRRAALLLVLAVSVLASVASLGYILYRLFGAIFGVSSSGDPSSELSRAIGAVVAAATVAAYHGLLLRRDGALRTAAEPAAVTAAERATVALLVRGPAGIGVAEVRAAVQHALPAGYELADATVPPVGHAEADPGTVGA